MRELSLSDFKNKMGGRLSGGLLLTNCLFHEDSTPSLGVYSTPEPHYYCFGCHASGSWEDLWAALGGPSTVKSPLVWPKRVAPLFARPRVLGDLDEYIFRSHHALTTQPHLWWYLQDREILSALSNARLGWDRGWLVIPIVDREWHDIGVIWRAYPHVAAKTTMRYDLPFGQPPMMYVPDWNLWDNAEVHYVVFGVLDAISMAIAGLGACSPTAGKASFDPKWLDKTDTSVVVVPDRYEDRDAFELAGHLDWRGRVYLPKYADKEKDLNNILVQRGPEGLRDAVAEGF